MDQSEENLRDRLDDRFGERNQLDDRFDDRDG